MHVDIARTGGAPVNPMESPMATDVEELTVTYVEDGIETVKELDKQVLTKGAWSTIIFRYQDKSKFNISSKDQAEKIIAALQSWIS